MGGTRGNPPGSTDSRGNIEVLPSGSLRVRVYAGKDILTGDELYLRKTIPAGPTAWETAEKVRAGFVRQVQENRQPKTNASLVRLIAEHLKTAKVGPRAKETLEGYVRKHIAPKESSDYQWIGARSIGEIGVQILETFYAELARCRDHCDGRPHIRHYTDGDHKCTRRCRRHICQPLADSTIRKIHFLISTAYKRAIRWEWVSFNPAATAEKPAVPTPDPQPPTTEEAAALVTECWRWYDLGPFVWVKMTTGARRGELCALRWRNIDVMHQARGEHDCYAAGCQWVLIIRRAIAQTDDDGYIWEKDTKTHQKRRVALDPETVAVLAEHRQRCERAAREAGFTLLPEHYMFAATPEGTTPRSPRSMSGRYKRCAKRLGIATSLKCLRHYSATELITGGVDVRTVAGRLGHKDGTTTLKWYTAWLSAMDQFASRALMSRIPERPELRRANVAQLVASPEGLLVPEPAPIRYDPRRRHEVLAADMYESWQAGELSEGTELTVNGLAHTHSITRYTAHQVITHLKLRGVVSVRNGNRSVVLSRTETTVRVTTEAVVQHVQITEPRDMVAVAQPVEAVVDTAETSAPQVLLLELLHLGTRVRKLSARADPHDFDALEQLMRDAIHRTAGDTAPVGEYELAVHLAGQAEPVTTLVVAA